jgi:hypothetical protein
MSAENEDLLIKKFATPDDDPDAPIVLKGGNPFTKTEEKCLLCKYGEFFDQIENIRF